MPDDKELSDGGMACVPVVHVIATRQHGLRSFPNE